ncbi:MAG: hypothetical protein ACRDLL_10025, partial [Solirubrobacterales bacterium]
MRTRSLISLAATAFSVAVLALWLGFPGVAGAATPSCATGPVDVAGTIYGTPCADTIVAPPGVAAVQGGGGDDLIVPAAILAAASCPEECRLGIGSQTFEGGPGDDVV